MTLITYQRRAVAIAGLAPHIDQRPDGDPLKRFVCFLALYARDVQTGRLPDEPRHYLPRRAERYAREALIPAGEFAANAHRPDAELAERFGVPLEQIARRRDELGAGLAEPAATLRRSRRRPAGRAWCQRAGRRGTIPG
jgi:hypothetical protein